MSPKVLLLQARAAADPMKEHEHRCFVSRTGLSEESVVPHDLCYGPPSLDRLRSHDALMVGGSGDYYVSRGNLPQFDDFLAFLREVVAAGHPTFCSCFGFQSMVRALGGNIVHDPASAEVGTYPLTLTESGRSDPLFGDLPVRFAAQMGHKDQVTRLPEGVVNLASSERSPFQALRIPGQPVWATQFHPELDRTTSLERLRCYREAYGGDSEQERSATLDRFGESPQASSLLKRFLQLVFA